MSAIDLAIARRRQELSALQSARQSTQTNTATLLARAKLLLSTEGQNENDNLDQHNINNEQSTPKGGKAAAAASFEPMFSPVGTIRFEEDNDDNDDESSSIQHSAIGRHVEKLSTTSTTTAAESPQKLDDVILDRVRRPKPGEERSDEPFEHPQGGGWDPSNTP